MPLPTLPIPLYPTIPLALGVPLLRRASDAVSPPVDPLLMADGAGSNTYDVTPTWGIYNGSAKALEPDSFVTVDYAKDWRVSDYPQEKGAFESYNKVTRPYDLRLTVTKGGPEADRAKFLADCETLAASLDLLSVVTPEQTYLNANVVHIDYRRTSAKGVTLLTVDLFFMEIRTTVAVEFAQTTGPTAVSGTQLYSVVGVPLALAPAQPSGASPSNIGTVAPREITQATAVFLGIPAGIY